MLNCLDLKKNTKKALSDGHLQTVLEKFCAAREQNRSDGISRLPEFQRISDQAVEMKTRTLENLDYYLEIFEKKVIESGGQAHWAQTAAEACDIIGAICNRASARKGVKGKSMVTEEIGLNHHLIRGGLQVLETDLGEYIVQLRGETPSHIIGPALHVSADQVADTFRRHHTHLPPERNLDDPASMVLEARKVLREHFLTADVGITGANFLVAETGSAVIVTNEGNADLSQTLPKTHIVVTGIDKVVPTLNDAATLLRILPRSVTGQESAVYTTIATGPRRRGDTDGPEAFHVVLLDNGRTKALGTPFQEMLRCIRCSACMNHCPVYGRIGGHAYGWIYPGPMGQVLTPLLLGLENAIHHPNACSLCGKCREVCPMQIPLPDMLRTFRETLYQKKSDPPPVRIALKLWAAAAKRPGLYGLLTAWGAGFLGFVSKLPVIKIPGKRLPAPEGKTFRQLWKKRGGSTGGHHG
jgi:L-lactate dehydrogenase complex protein LldF